MTTQHRHARSHVWLQNLQLQQDCTANDCASTAGTHTTRDCRLSYARVWQYSAYRCVHHDSFLQE